MNINDVALYSENAALKLVERGTGTIIAPATSTSASNTNIIFHGLDTTDIMWSVAANSFFVSASNTYVTIPWSSSDGRISIDAYIDKNNLYIKATSSTAGSPQPATSFDYSYTIILI